MLPQDCGMPLCMNSYDTLCSDCNKSRCIVEEHVGAEAKVYLVLMCGLDIHDFNPTWQFSCTEIGFFFCFFLMRQPKAFLIMSVLCMSRQ